MGQGPLLALSASAKHRGVPESRRFKGRRFWSRIHNLSPLLPFARYLPLFFSFDATMIPTLYTPELPVEADSKATGFKSKGIHSPLQIHLRVPLSALTKAGSDSDVESPSPLTVCFDFLKSSTASPLTASPLSAATTWTDTDSESDDSEDDEDDEGQVVSIPVESEFYTPHPPPTFQTTFDIPAESQVICISADSPFYTPPSPPSFKTTFEDLPDARDPGVSDQVAALLHAELGHILPSKNLFLIEEESLAQLDDDVVSAPLESFVDVCLARLRSTTPVPELDGDQSLPCYHLVSFSGVGGDDSLAPELRDLFYKPVMLSERQTARSISAFL
uniref:Uncharacterized protein n=1 Tax=Mycena chlorophos TaxID=658473 RepID=A0ABQ0LKF3_MYCCL|nr:predicted protein [Mycena chlorophos]